MRKVKFSLNRVTGVVALSYLALIPAAGIFLLNRQRMLEQNMEEVLYQINANQSSEEGIPRGRR